MQVAVHIGLLVWTLAAVALGIGHRDAQRQVLVLHAVQVIEKAGSVLRAAARVVDACRDLADGVQCIVHEIALGAAGFLADQAHGFQLVEQVTGAGVDVSEPVHALAAGLLHSRHDGRVLRLERVVVGECDGVDAGAEGAFVGHAVHLAAIDEYVRLVLAQ